MTRLLPLAGFSLVAVTSVAFVGCGTATTREDVDSGITVPDTGGAARDTGITLVGDGSVIVRDAAPISDSGMITRRDAGPFMRPDTGTGGGGHDAGTTAGVMCGTAVCTGTDVCCITRSAGGMMISTACTTTTACASAMGAPLACDGPEDCTGGQVCCGMFGGGRASAGCEDPALCTYGRLCHTAADCTGTDLCRAFMGFSVCSRF